MVANELDTIQRKFFTLKISRDSEETEKLTMFSKSILHFTSAGFDDKDFDVMELHNPADYTSTDSVIRHNDALYDAEILDVVT